MAVTVFAGDGGSTDLLSARAYACAASHEDQGAILHGGDGVVHPAEARHQGDETLVISALATFAAHLLAPRLGHFQIAHPEITTRVEVDHRLADLLAGEASVAITAPDWAKTIFGQLITASHQIIILWWLVFALVLGFVMHQTRIGNWIFAMGGDRVSARNAGIPVGKLTIKRLSDGEQFSLEFSDLEDREKLLSKIEK